ncbi:hypothetical protein [Segetibacter sp.]|uniref:hypothetical protein n=1 Tax=Segetibacter sp. TaxID=2231182 RepID=UPI002629CD98|nr:hypothetical protein [Segetibacter sp.]MCW3078995.1 hypothetical protein [Segetibacter sp.]
MNKQKLYTVFFIVVMLSSVSSHLFSQTVKAGVDRNKIFIGEQVRLKLAIEGGRAGMKWFSFPDSLNHFEIVKRGKVDTVLNGSSTNYYQVITITSFDSGRWEFPSLFLPGLSQPTPPIAIDVLPVDVSKMEDYNDIKDIEEVTQQNDPLLIGLIAAITLLSLLMLYWLFAKKRKVIVERRPAKGSLSPLDRALAELNKLKGQNLQTPAEVKKYYSALTDISRTFFNQQLQQQSLQQTTDEWMMTLHPLSVDNETKTSFFQVLRLADTVKFAKFLPHSRDNETSVEVIKNMLQKVSLLHSPIHSNYQPNPA